MNNRHPHGWQWLASFKLPDEPGVEMRLLAYASEPVLDASRAAGKLMPSQSKHS